MKLQKSQKRLTGLAIIVLSYVLIELGINWEKYTSYYFSDKKQAEIIRPVIPKDSRSHENKAMGGSLNWNRDPFKLPVRQIVQKQRKSKTISTPKLQLKAITKDAENAFVMINESILKEGEIVKGYRIEKIYPDKVKLSINGAFSYLYLDKEGN